MTKTVTVGKAKSSKKPDFDGGKYILNCEPSRKTLSDWSIEVASDAGVLAAASVPPSIDLRAPWWKIGDQGQTGSCVGWSSTDAVIRWHFVKRQMIQQTEQLSVRQVWIASKETDEITSAPTTYIETAGTTLKSALDVARKFGVVMESVLPFAGNALYSGTLEAFYSLAAQRKISSYFNLRVDLLAWRSWIATNGPILTRLDVDDTWYNASQTLGALQVYHRPAKPAGHAVAIVGYTPTHFIVRNSWGAAWGDQGFGYASNAYAAAAFTEAYGIAV